MGRKEGGVERFTTTYAHVHSHSPSPPSVPPSLSPSFFFRSGGNSCPSLTTGGKACTKTPSALACPR